ncbi:MAG TPA: patatin-like phospholipase family protein [Nocardioidaceae bacterium]|nr:patatin-like phospholipase family protein [Nocardioidaceae bacterium]
MRRGLVIGGGGTLGAAWSVGALSAVEEALDWDARTATVIVGSGSGAEIAAVLGASFTTQDMVNALSGSPLAPRVLAEQFAAERRLLPSLPIPAPSSIGLAVAGLRRRVPAQSAISGLLPVGTGSFDRVVDFGRTLSRLSTGTADGWVPHPATWVVAADRRNGRRVPLGFRGAPKTDLGVALAAASARPGWFPPVRIGDRAYVEASVASPTSSDLVLPLGLDEVVVIAPTSSRDAGVGFGISMLERIFRRGTTMRVDLEESVLQADGTLVIRVEPGPDDLAAMGVNPMDHRRRREVLLTSLSTSRERVARAIQRSGIGVYSPTISRNDAPQTAALETPAQPQRALTVGPLLVEEPAEGEPEYVDATPREVEAFSPPPPAPPQPTVWQRLLRWFGAGRPAA